MPGKAPHVRRGRSGPHRQAEPGAKRPRHRISPHSVQRWVKQADIDDGLAQGETSGETARTVLAGRSYRLAPPSEAAWPTQLGAVDEVADELA